MSFFTRFFALLSAFFIMLFSPSTTYTKKGEATVMTYNILCDELTDERLGRVVEQIRSIAPASFGCQEVKESSKQYLENALSEYGSFFVSDETSDTTYNALFWLKSGFTLVDSGYIFLSTTPNRPSTGWDARHRRTLQWVVLEDKTTGCRYVHANTHFDHVGTTARDESAKLVNSTFSNYSCPIVVSGDFNCRYTGETIKSFLSMGWQNTMNMCGITSSTDTYHGYTGEDTNHSPIDHIFVKGAQSASDWTIHKDKFGGQYPSDHFPLSVHLSFDYTISAKQNYQWLKEAS